MQTTTSKNSVLDTKLRDHGWGNSTGDIGLEIEVEGSLKAIADVHAQPKYWTSKQEGSLRGGVEYVLYSPVPMRRLPDALDEIGKVFEKCPKIVRSIRCSTHMHVNVSDLTIQQIYNVIGYYYLIEDILVNTQGPIRKGNLFCLRMSDAEFLAEALIDSAQMINDPSRGFCLTRFDAHNFKYGALNLAAPTKFGSLEFRFLRPMTDKADLGFWSGVFYTLVHEAKNISLEESLRKAEELTPQGFLELVFPSNVATRMTEGISPTELSEMLLQNYDHIWNLSRSFDDTDIYIPSIYLMTDTGSRDFYGYEEGIEKGKTAAQKWHISNL